MSLHPTASLLSIAAAIAFLVTPAAAQPANGITREVYANIGGSSIPDLTNNPAFPNFPTTEAVLTNNMDCPVDFMENYGTRLRALVVPPTTGAYTFWVASDDQSVLYLSTDATPANKVLIARVNAWTSWKEWTKEANQQSAPITLNAGQQYYLEALQKEGGGGDSLTVRWQLPSGTIEEPLPASRCIPVGVTAPLLLQQPTNITVVEGNQAIFAVRFTHNFNASIQWRRNSTNIPDATETNLVIGPVTLADSGTPFSCVVANPYGSSPTSNAVLTVVADTTPPTISSVGNLGDNDIITIVFSEPVETATATAIVNYAINNGISVLNVTFGVDTRTIVLTTTPLAVNVNYTITVNNVRDRAAAPNTIAANTQRTFSRNARPLDIAFLKPGPELPGPSTRRGPLVISEVMYHPTNRTDLRNVEFIEIYNSNPWFEEMGGFKISGAVDYTFPSNFVLGARSYVVVAANPADVQFVYGISAVQGPWIGTLQNGDGTLRIRNNAGAVMFEMEYTGDPPFPAAADGAGHSLVLARPSYGEGDARAWAASDLIGGTPGTNEVAGTNPFRTVMINEFLAHTDLPNVDYIELFNYSTQTVNLTGCVLTDDPSTNKFIIPAGTIIPTNGFLVFYETNLGFALNAEGETIYLKNPQRTRVLEAVHFEAQENGVATGRYPDGAKNFSRLQNPPTPGASNTRQRAPVVVINEIMYDPVTDDSDDEFVELYNPGNITLNIGKWRLKDAVKFTIPNNTLIPPKGYIVIAARAARLRANYPNLNILNCLGDWEGTLKNRGERISLTMPDTIVSTNGLGALVTNTIHIVMDEVTYADGGRWGKFAAGGGSSLELRDWHADRRLAPNWGDSDESAKQDWINVEATGTMDNGYESATQLHVTLMGAGEALIDNIEVFAPTYGNTNLIGNATFDNGTSGWVFQGNHNQTSWEPGAGYFGAGSLHLRATGRGDTGANRTRIQLPFTLPNGTANVTLRAKVRWLKGRPNLLLRLRGNYHEAPGYTLTVKNL
ncbi:MAG TPA: lamin tail domain-containing protein, partial [Verrucomicrobiae bacterium]